MLFKDKTKSLGLLSLVGIASIFLIIGIILTIIWIKIDKNDEVVVEIDKTVIVQKIQKKNVLETVKETSRRDLKITLNDGDFTAFGITILENKRTQELSIVGSVSAGVDLSKVDENSISISDDKKTLTIKLPEPEITHVEISSDNDLLDDRSTLLFKLSNLTNDEKRKITEKLYNLSIENGKKALVDAACKDSESHTNILKQANQNAKEAIEDFFGILVFDKIEVITTESNSCEYNSL